MMSTSNDFAFALFMLAVEKNKCDEFYDDLITIRTAFNANPEYAVLLSSPGVPKRERTALIDTAFGGRVDEDIVNFLKVLCEHNKVTEVFDCIKVFSELKKQSENQITAHVTSAIPLEEEQISRLKEQLTKKLGSNVRIKTAIDKHIIGGVKIEFEDKIIDGSIKRQLHDIKEVISG